MSRKIIRPADVPNLISYGTLKEGTNDFRAMHWEEMTTIGVPVGQVSMVARYHSQARCVYLYVTSGHIVGLEFTDPQSAEDFAEDVLNRIDRKPL